MEQHIGPPNIQLTILRFSACKGTKWVCRNHAHVQNSCSKGKECVVFIDVCQGFVDVLKIS